MIQNSLCSLLQLQYPIIQGGMVYASGYKLASACSKAGILGVLGAGSMSLDILEQQLIKLKKKVQDRPVAVNIPLLYSKVNEQVDLCLKHGIKIFITSAGSPKIFTKKLKEAGCTVLHVVSNDDLAAKCEDAGVDAVIAEGFEAGGHNGRDELTTLTLIPLVKKRVSIPVIAAGGIASGEAIAAMMVLGADGVQMGTRFLMTQESSVHENYKNLLRESTSHSTELVMKKVVPVRLWKNEFYQKIKKKEESDATKEELVNLLGKGRARKGMLEGDMVEGELEIGQVCGLIKDLPKVDDLVKDLVSQYNLALSRISKF